MPRNRSSCLWSVRRFAEMYIVAFTIVLGFACRSDVRLVNLVPILYVRISNFTPYSESLAPVKTLELPTM